ncbi:MAG: radical SAM protein [Elusimicrobia bacterium]|nr:radical SAM protein [Elusimicrobiota bacterium]
MAFRRLKLLGLIKSRLKALIYLLKTRGLKSAYNFIWVHIFTRDSGLALMDPIIRKFPILAPYPEQIEVEITTKCHLKCTMCEHTYWNEQPKDMSLDEFKKIIDQFPKLKWLGITGIGSNFLNKDFIQILSYVKRKSVYVEFFDTFDLINEINAEELIKVGVDKIWMSIDAANKETYNAIRIGTDFDKVVRNVKTLMKIKKKYKSPFPEIFFHFIINNSNFNELPDFIRLVHSIVNSGYNLATLIYFSSILQFKEIEYMKTTLPEKIKTETEKCAKDLNIFVGWNQNIKQTRCVKDCTRWTEPFILATGHVQPCCAINEANTRQYQKDNSLGNLLYTDFRKIWKNEFNDLINSIHNNKFPDICRHCRNFVQK